MAKSIEKAVQFMVDVANDNSHGYDQSHRNGPDYDCSSLVGTALNKAGFNVNKSSTTRNLYSQLIKEGFKVVSGSRKRGDIFLKVGHHVVMCTDSNNIVHASINEKGTTTGGKTGDQTGKEICTRSWYNYSGGWDYHLRYNGYSSSSSYDDGVLRKGDKGSDVKTMQNMLIKCGYSCGKYGADGDFGSGTESALEKFQKDYGLEVDGEYGKNSKAKLTSVYNDKTKPSKPSGYDQWVADLQKELNKQGFRDSNGNKLEEDGLNGNKTLSACPNVKKGAKGGITKLIQKRLKSVGFNKIDDDGIFGDYTKTCVEEFQKNRGLDDDGVVGKNTWKYLLSGKKY